MGFFDELGRAAANAFRAANDGLSSFNEAAEQARTSRAADDAIEKAVAAAKADGRIKGEHDPAEDPRALPYDPFDLVAAMGYREKPSPLAFQSMERIGRGVPVIADVIKVRSTQVTTFCKPPEDRHAPGFEVRLRDRNASVTPAAEARIADLEKMLLNTGWGNDEDPHESVSLGTFSRQFIEDSLIYDQACFEVVPDAKGDPSYVVIVDPATVRLVDPITRSPGDPYCVQVIHGSIVQDFTPDQLAFCVRNPRSGVRTFGYGCSEIETLVREITGFLWSIEYNRKFFTQGSAAKGILNFKGTLPERHLQAFRRQWYAMMMGVGNAFRTPITNAEGLEWINLQLSNRDMEYGQWMDFLIKVVCARFQIAPEEVNFQYGNTHQQAAMGGAQQAHEEKLKSSRDLGLRPLVYWFFDQLNRWWLQRVDCDFEVRPVGLDTKGAEAEAELLQKQTAVFLTIDEAREASGIDPLGPEHGGDAILNPTWLQYMQGKQQQGQPPGQGEGPPQDSSKDFGVEPSRFDQTDQDFAGRADSDFGVEPDVGAAEPPGAESGGGDDMGGDVAKARRGGGRRRYVVDL